MLETDEVLELVRAEVCGGFFETELEVEFEVEFEADVEVKSDTEAVSFSVFEQPATVGRTHNMKIDKMTDVSSFL